MFLFTYIRQAFSFALILLFIFSAGVTIKAQKEDSFDPQQKLPDGVKHSEYMLRNADGKDFQGFRMEPPNWWIGMTDSVVEVLIYDKNIKGSSVQLEYSGVKKIAVHEVENPNYLFIELQIDPSAKPGNIPIQLTKAGKSKIYKYPILEKDALGGQFHGLNTQDIIYLIMPDRFANGDDKNDSYRDMQQKGIDRRKMYFRHGGDLQGIMDKLDYLDTLGITALWLNPVQENNQPYESYHGYAVTDLYNIDKRLGSNDLYKELVKRCHEKGIKVVMDIIHNHVGDQHWFIKDLPDRNWIHQHDTFIKTSYRDQVYMDPYVSTGDFNRMNTGWFDRHMPDLNQQHPRLARYLIQNNIWWIAYADLDAYRIDTYAYPDRSFMANWAKKVNEAFPKVSLFAETWVHGSPNQAFFTQQNNMRGKQNNYMPAVTDFQMYYAITEALNQEQGWTSGAARMYHTMSHDFLYEDAYRNVVFLDNHDVSRIYSVLGENKDKLKSALSWMMTTRGIPQLYYGTEILLKNHADPDGKVRQDFPGGWPADGIDKFQRAGRTVEEEEIFRFTQSLIKMRKSHPALGSGKLIHYIPENGVYIYIRYDESERIVIIMNTHGKEQNVATSRFSEWINDRTEWQSLPDYNTENIPGTMNIPAFSTKMYLMR